MSSKTPPCFYHETTSSISSCFRCHRPICSQDTSSYEDNHGDYMMVRDFCVPCNRVRTIMENRPLVDYIAYVFLLVWSALVLYIFFPLIIFSYFLYKSIYNNRKNKVAKLIETKKEFDNFLLTISDDKKPAFTEEIIIYCYNCNTIIADTDRFCPTCLKESPDTIDE